MARNRIIVGLAHTALIAQATPRSGPAGSHAREPPQSSSRPSPTRPDAHPTCSDSPAGTPPPPATVDTVISRGDRLA
jgi:hypothetical protein